MSANFYAEHWESEDGRPRSFGARLPIIELFMDRSIESMLMSLSITVGTLDKRVKKYDWIYLRFLDTEDKDSIIFSGQVDSISRSVSENRVHSMTIECRSAGGELVDSSVPDSLVGQHRSIEISQLMRELCREFDAPYDLLRPADPIENVVIENGEGCLALLSRLALITGSLIYSSPLGLCVCPSGLAEKEIDQISSGIKSPTYTETGDSRYREIQVVGDGGDEFSSYLAMSGKVVDPSVPPRRRLVLSSNTAADPKDFQRLAEYEGAIRFASSEILSFTLVGWSMRPSRARKYALWPLNVTTRVFIPVLDIDRDFLVASCSNSWTKAGGEVTKMTVVDPKSFVPQPFIPEREF